METDVVLQNDPREYFGTHRLNITGFAAAEMLALKFSELFTLIDMLGIASRQKSLAFTHLEIASFYAKKAMAMDYNNQDIVKPEAVSETTSVA